ncbi:dihydropyrimidinase [Ruminococcaceae bacterium OttesenSCG-928-D13]|nr:dihydropyrimidinase [Ruminococcaceae bacterium OttesenSCG-928-D13]
MTTLIKNGEIITSSAEFRGDILIEDEVIAAVGADLGNTADTVIDAAGKVVFPGGVDQHTHYSALCNTGDQDTAGYETSDSALVGGTTTVVDYAPQDPGKGLIESAQYRIDVRAKDKVCVDYALHGFITYVTDDNSGLYRDIARLSEMGIHSIKCFMAYKNSPLHVDDGVMFRVMQESKKHGITVFVHTENGDVIDEMQRECIARGEVAPKYHAETRPSFCEGEAAQRALYLAQQAGGTPLCIVHNTSKAVCDVIAEARGRLQPVMGETCAHYLFLDKSYLANPDFEVASRYVLSPALRDKCEQEHLWQALRDGTLHTIASDHVGIGMDIKRQGLDRFDRIPNGAPGAPDRIPMLWSHGVEKGKLSRVDFVRFTATNPAKVCGLYPGKGDIAPGFDADIVLYDRAWRGAVRWADNPNGADFNIYEGFEQLGRVETVLLRGKVVVEQARFVGSYGQGRFLRTRPYGACYTGL